MQSGGEIMNVRAFSTAARITNSTNLLNSDLYHLPFRSAVCILPSQFYRFPTVLFSMSTLVVLDSPSRSLWPGSPATPERLSPLAEALLQRQGRIFQ